MTAEEYLALPDLEASNAPTQMADPVPAPAPQSVGKGHSADEFLSGGSAPSSKGGYRGPATTFGYNDPQDNGIGFWGTPTNNPHVVGVSLSRKALKENFGSDYEQTAFGKPVQVTNPATGKSIVAPIVDIGPAGWVEARQGSTIDLTHAANQALGGTGKTPMEWKVKLSADDFLGGGNAPDQGQTGKGMSADDFLSGAAEPAQVQEKAPPAMIDIGPPRAVPPVGGPATPPPPTTAPSGIAPTTAPPPSPAPLKPLEEPGAKREVGFGESFSRESARMIYGMGEALNRFLIAPVLQGTALATQAVVPGSAVAKITDKANKDWWNTMVNGAEAVRKSLEIDPNTEVQGLKGEAGGMIGNLFPQLLGAAATPGAIAVKFLLPSVTSGMDAMNRARENGASPAQQIASFAWGFGESEAFVNLPLHVKSAAAGPIMRFIERTTKATLVAGGAQEGLRDINNLITPITGGEQQPFDWKALAKVAIPMGVFGGVMGENARPRPQGPIASQAFPKGEPAPPMPGGETPRITGYHGTPDTTFEEISTKGLGAHFSTDKSIAKAFSGKGGRTHEVQLDIKNPLRVKDFGGSHTSAEGVAESLIKEGVLPKDYINDDFYERIIGKGKTLEEQLNDHERRNIAELERIKDILKKKGHDGLVYENTTEGGGDSYVAFDSGQIHAAPKPKSEWILQHASPHDFERFSIKGIGTGEGRQAFGRGLYFSEGPGTHKAYLAKFGGEGKAVSYKVRINAGQDQFIDWDKPLSEQSDFVKDKLKDIGVMDPDGTLSLKVVTPGEKARSAKMAASEFMMSQMPYADIMAIKMAAGLSLRAPAHPIYGPHGAAEFLRSIGIKGIRYLDAISRGKGEGTRNVVVFDDGIVDILEKNGKPVSGKEAPAPAGEERFAPGAPKPAQPYSPLPEAEPAGVGLVASPETQKAIAEVKEIGKEVKKAAGVPRTTEFVRAVKEREMRKQRSAQLIENMHQEITGALLKDVKANAKQVKVRTEGITNYLQAGGDRATLQGWLDGTKDRKLRAGYEAALNLTPREVAAAGRVRAIFDDYLPQLRAAGVEVSEFKNYVTGMWQAKLAEKAGTGIPRTMSDYFKYKKQKFFENYFQGEQEGYVPKTKDIREILAHYMHAAETTISNRKLLADLKSMTAEDGLPLLSTQGRGESVEGPAGPATLIFPKGTPKEAADGQRYVNLDFPALRDWKWVAKDSAGNPVLMQGDLTVHPDIAPHLKNLFGQSTLDKWWGSPSKSRLEAYTKGITRLLLKDIQQYYKGTLFAGIPSGFHLVHQAGEMGMAFRINPFRGIEKPDLINNPEHIDMANHGLMLGPTHPGAEYFTEGVGGGQKNLVTLGLRKLAEQKGMGYAANVADGIDAYSKWLFQHYIPGLGIKAYRVALPRNMKRFEPELKAGTLTESDIKDLTANQVNASTGHINMEAHELGSNKNVQQALSMFLISPHFTVGRLTKVAQAVPAIFGARKGREQLIGLGITAAMLYGASRVLNLIIDGDPHFEWQRAFQVKVGNRWVGMRSIPGDAQRALPEEWGGQNFGPWFFNRTSPYLHLATSWLTGYNSRGQKVSLGRALYDMFLGGTPMPAQGLTTRMTQLGSADKLAWWEHLAGSMGFPIQRYNPTNEVKKDAIEWQKKNKPLTVREMTFGPSKYSNLEFALEENDPTRIKEEIANLKEQGMKLEDIVKDYAERIDHPYTSNQENDRAFSKSIFADQNKLKASRARKVALIARLQASTGIKLEVPRDARYFLDRGQ
jgi:hypothetical protein